MSKPSKSSVANYCGLSQLRHHNRKMNDKMREQAS
jgi:hypothetical protein